MTVSRLRPFMALAIISVVTACGVTQPPGSFGPSLGALGSFGPASEDAIAAYGYAPRRDPSVSLQPDVVIVGGGASAIRGVSGDTLTWTIDKNAPGAANLAEGKVMFLTSKAVGRVAAIRDEADTRVILLAPVELTDVIRDGTFDFDLPFDLSTFRQRPFDYPAALSDPAPGDLPPPPLTPTGALGGAPLALGRSPDGTLLVRTAPLQLSLRPAGSGQAGGLAAASGSPPSASPGPSPSASIQPTAPPQNAKCLEAQVGIWIAKPCVSEEGKLSLELNVEPNQGLKLGIVIALLSKGPRLAGDYEIKAGDLVGRNVFLDGLQGIELSLAGGVANGASDNHKARIEVPLEFDVPLPPTPNGIPLNLKVTFEIVVETAFSGKNSTFSTQAKYRFDSGAGTRNGQVVTPNMTVDLSILDSMGGLPVGVSGLVFAPKIKFLAGVGVPAATAGPYFFLQGAFGVSQGSALGSPLVQCRGATVGLKGGVGIGLALDAEKTKWLKGVIPEKLMPKVETEWEQTFDIFKERTEIIPNVPLCKV